MRSWPFFMYGSRFSLFIFQQRYSKKPNFRTNTLHFCCCMIFGTHFKSMQHKNSTSTVLIVLLIVFTFPIWIGIAGGLFGIVVGIFGAIFGIIAGVFGAVFGTIGGVFGWLFNWDWPFGGFFHWNILTILIIAVIIVLVSRSRRA